MTEITSALIRAVAPACREPDAWARELAPVCVRYEINTPLRVAAFLAQNAHESTSFNNLEENLLYSAERLMVVWPSRFYSISVARKYEYNPKKLANLVYADRLGNGNEASGDGYRYRGRGLPHLTGKANYVAFSRATGEPVVTDPDLLLTKPIAALSGGEFWHSRKLNALADKNDFEGVTKRINGGLIGYLKRLRYYERARKALGLGPSGA
jgi:putative chitinase